MTFFRPILVVFFISNSLFCFSQINSSVTDINIPYRQIGIFADSTTISQIDNATKKIEDEINLLARNYLSELRNKLNSSLLIQNIKIPKSQFEVNNVLVDNDVSIWMQNGKQYNYMRNNAAICPLVVGIPFDSRLFYTYRQSPEGYIESKSFRVNYNREEFFRSIGLDKLKISESLLTDFTKKFGNDYKDKINNDFRVLKNLVENAGLKWEDFLFSTQTEVAKKLQASKQEINTEQLKTYYKDYLGKSGKYYDSVISNRIAKIDSANYKNSAQKHLLEKIIIVKKKLDILNQKVEKLKVQYDSTIKNYIETYNITKEFKRIEGLSGFQRIASKINGLKLGEHALNKGGRLALANFMQNGITIDFENKNSGFWITKNLPFENQPVNQAFINGTAESVNYYAFGANSYLLTGLGLRRFNERSLTEINVLNFQKKKIISNPLMPENIQIVTIAKLLKQDDTYKFLIELSKNFVRQGVGQKENGSLVDPIAINTEFSLNRQAYNLRNDLRLFYATSTYYNPGINGGLSRPGFDLTDNLIKRLGKKISLNNKLRFYKYNINSDRQVKYAQDNFGFTYKIPRGNIGTRILYSETFQTQPGITDNKTKGFDILATAQRSWKLAQILLDCNSGFGFGYTNEASSVSNNVSYYFNSSLQYRKWNVDLEINKYASKTTQVFIIDSAYFIGNNTFNFRAGIGYSGKKGNYCQVGFLSNDYGSGKINSFFDFSLNFRIGNRLSIMSSAKVPVLQPVELNKLPVNLFVGSLQYKYKKK